MQVGILLQIIQSGFYFPFKAEAVTMPFSSSLLYYIIHIHVHSANSLQTEPVKAVCRNVVL